MSLGRAIVAGPQDASYLSPVPSGVQIRNADAAAAIDTHRRPWLTAPPPLLANAFPDRRPK